MTKEGRNMNEWEPTTTDIKSVDWKGNPILITKVPAKRDSKTGKVRVNPIEVARAEARQIAEDLGLEERDIPLFLLLYAKPGPFQAGYLCEKNKINKMLFYIWKELEKEGLGEAFPHDEFEAKKNGPVPKHLFDDFDRLGRLSLISVEGGRTQKKHVSVNLTKKGETVAAQLWNRVPDPYLAAASRVKDWLFPLDPETIMQRVHREFPRFRKTYIEPDVE